MNISIISIIIINLFLFTLIMKMMLTCMSSKRRPHNVHERQLDQSRHCTFERASAASDQGWSVIIMLILIETEMILLIAITF